MQLANLTFPMLSDLKIRSKSSKLVVDLQKCKAQWKLSSSLVRKCARSCLLYTRSKTKPIFKLVPRTNERTLVIPKTKDILKDIPPPLINSACPPPPPTQRSTPLWLDPDKFDLQRQTNYGSLRKSEYPLQTWTCLNIVLYICTRHLCCFNICCGIDLWVCKWL